MGAAFQVSEGRAGLSLEKIKNSILTNRGESCILVSNSIKARYDDREKIFPRTLQRVAGRCEAMQSGEMSLALEYFR